MTRKSQISESLKIKLVGQLRIYLNIAVPSILMKSSTSENFHISGNPINRSVTPNSIFVHFFGFVFVCLFPSSHCEMRAIHFQELSYTTYSTYTTDGRIEIASMSEVVDRVAVNN